MTTRGPSPTAADRLGTTLGSYRLTALLGEGSMGEVYLAEHTRLGRVVALKRLRDRHASRSEAVKRFIDEAWAVNHIRHPNIVTITDLVAGDEGVYCIMERLEGEPLSEALARVGSFPPAVALALIRQAVDALAAAHAKGVVHRDVKPSNLFLECPTPPPGEPRPLEIGRARLKVLDFGIALLDARAGGDAIRERVGDSAQSGLLTPAYMSPEQADGREVDARSDVYSLGAVLFELLTGTPPFRAGTFVEYVYQHTSVPAPRLSEACAFRFHGDLEALVARCLAKEADARYADAGALRDALGAVLDQPKALRRRAPGRLPWILGGLAALAGIVALALVLGPCRRGAPPRERHAPTPPVTPDATLPRPGTTPDAAVPRPIVIRLATTPPGAEVHRLSPRPTLLGLTPLRLTVPPDPGPWRLALRRAGFQERQLTMTPDRAQEHRLLLTPAGPSSRRPPPRPGSTPREVSPRPRRDAGPPRAPARPREAPAVIDPFAPMPPERR